mmetsp:Transcript_58766/g.97472  ORF Transcript_58766/g.97472 Transcript_58766/m.97472 type:complete len:99 (-) Transcript_58766:1355-1651(-)
MSPARPAYSGKLSTPTTKKADCAKSPQTGFPVAATIPKECCWERQQRLISTLSHYNRLKVVSALALRTWRQRRQLHCRPAPFAEENCFPFLVGYISVG